MKKRAHNYKDITGTKHFHLTCLGDSGQRTSKGAVKWTWKCECGRQVLRTSSYIRAVKTCGVGCRISSEIKSSALKGFVRPFRTKPGVLGLKRLYEIYVRRCQRKKISFGLSIEQFAKLTKQNCHYCGSEPTAVYKHKEKGLRKESIENGAYTYNTLDRIEPSKGYIAENIVAACRLCNIMKWDSTVEDFRNRIERIYHHFVREKS